MKQIMTHDTDNMTQPSVMLYVSSVMTMTHRSLQAPFSLA